MSATLRSAVLFGMLLPAACDTGAPSDDAVDDGSEANDDSDESGGDDDDDDNDGSDGQECHQALEKGSEGLGAPCSSNAHCETLVCQTFETVPAADGGTCGETPPDCRSRIMGTVRDVLTRLPVAGANVSLMGGLEASAGVNQAARMFEEVSDADGHLDTITEQPVRALVGVLGLVEADGRVHTATGLASPIDAQGNYEPCFALRDWWTVSAADLTAWNESLATDDGAAPHLPLDDAWDTVGFVRTYTDAPEAVAGARIVPANANSPVVVRYLNEDGVTFNDTQTTSTGLFVLLGASLGEYFEIEVSGMRPWNEGAVRSGAFPDALWVMPLWMVPD